MAPPDHPDCVIPRRSGFPRKLIGDGVEWGQLKSDIRPLYEERFSRVLESRDFSPPSDACRRRTGTRGGPVTVQRFRCWALPGCAPALQAERKCMSSGDVGVGELECGHVRVRAIENLGVQSWNFTLTIAKAQKYFKNSNTSCSFV